MISASAGSGKTYQLARRYAHLLALGIEADDISAMTFTRKAAGEFFNRILRRLAELAVKPEESGAFFQDVEPPVQEGLDYTAMLRRVTRRLHRLRLGTLDSFFAGLMRCFPLELGLPASARVMQEDETRQALNEAVESLLDQLHAEPDHRLLHVLTESFKQATFGASEKTVDETLRQWAADCVSLWDESLHTSSSEIRGWGEVGKIWSQPLPPLQPLAEAVDAVRQHFKPPHDGGQKLLEETLDETLKTQPGMPLPKRLKDLLQKLSDLWPELQKGRGELVWSRKTLTLDTAAAGALRGLAETLMTREFLVRAERTRGLAAVTALLADQYAQKVRARGRLSFADVQRLLCDAARADLPWLGGRGDLWYRLDGRYDHWLLDEFQDTSRAQWEVLGSLVDEVIQDAEGQRSFFAVGDPKQSIYLWRQAEPDLFEDILRAYPANGERGLHQQPLSVSYRSSPAVLEAVNRVFGNHSALEQILPTGSLKGFSFLPHVASQKQLTGHATLLSPVQKEDLEHDATVVAAGAILREIEPLKRGLSCAVLVRQNKDATEVTEALRHLTGMEVVCEADQHPCTDNALTLALLSLLQLAAHPADAQALEHLKMTPLWPELTLADKSWRYHISAVQSLILERGFAAWMEEWIQRLQKLLPEMDAFHLRRLEQMTDIAVEYDLTGSRDVDAFIQFARDYPLRVRGALSAIQVMTIHASKGLEFDLVILPKLDGVSMDEVRRSELMISRSQKGVRWVLQTPPRVFAGMDATYRAELEEARRRGTFESLCRLYVAMTRARRGLYLIAEPAKKNSTALKESALLRATLAKDQKSAVRNDVNIEWETGVQGWYLSEKARPAEPKPERTAPAPVGPLLRETQPMPRRRTPSGEESFKVKGSVLFSPGREPGRRFGTRVHELFAEVEWLAPLEDITQRWISRKLISEVDLSESAQSPEALACQMVLRVLASEAGAEVFKPGSANSLLWRERPFDLVMDGEWVSGVFDRVQIERTTDGSYHSAWVIDFKTDDVSTEEALQEKMAGYGPQIAMYRQAIMKLTGLPREKIACSLLFTRLERLVHL